MNKLCMALAGTVLLAAGSSVLADDNGVVRTQSLQVKERLQVIERIDVTAEKPINPNAEPLDDDLLAILDEVQTIEKDQGVQQRVDDAH